MRFLGRSLLGLFLLAATAGLLALAAATLWSALQTLWAEDGAPRPVREQVFAAAVTEVVPETLRPVLTVHGEIRSRRRLELRAPVGGAIAWLSDGFEDGARVAAGDPLLRLDRQDAEGRREAARADLAEAEAELRDARRALELARDELAGAEARADLQRRALERQEDLVGRGVGSAAQVETAALALSTAEQAVLAQRRAVAEAQARIDTGDTARARARIALAEAERRLAETEIRAPFPGRLTAIAAVEGGLLGANEKIAELIDADALEVAFRLSTAQYARLLAADGTLAASGVTVSLDVAGLEIAAEGRISRDSPAVGEGQTGRLVFARLDTAAGFRPGDFVRVRITEPPLAGVARLPSAAVDTAGTVLVLGEGDRLHFAAAPILRREGDDVIVAAAEIAGARVVAQRTPFLGAGIKVRPVAPEPDEPGGQDGLVSLDADRRARLVAFVEGNAQLPDEARERMLDQLRAERVPAQMVARLEARMGG